MKVPRGLARVCALPVTAIALGMPVCSSADAFDLTVTLNTNTPGAAVATAFSKFCGSLSSLANRSADQQQLATICSASATAVNSADAYEALSARSVTAETTLSSRGPGAAFTWGGGGKRLVDAAKATAARAPEYEFDAERIPARWITAEADTKTTATESATTLPDGLLSKRWGGFVDASFARAQQDITNTEAGFKTQGNGLTGGVDYRYSDVLFFGSAARYLRNHGDLSGSTGSVKGGDFNLLLFGTYYPLQNLFVETSLGITRGNYDLTRNISFNLSGTPTTATAKSSTDTGALALTVAGGYDYAFRGNNAAFNASLLWSKNNIDGFTESGAGGFNLAVGDQTIDMLTLNLGAQISRAISTTWAVVLPQFAATWVHQFQDSGQKISARFTADPTATPFSFTTETRDADYFKLVLRSAFVFPRGISGFVNYERWAGYDNYAQSAVALGGRWEF